MHDYFDILGVSGDAPADEIRRASARRASTPHPDFHTAVDEPGVGWDGRAVSLVALTDLAIDFVDMSAIAARMQAAFFGRDT